MLVEMKKLVLIAHRSDRFNILKTLHQSKLTEIVATQNIPNTKRLDNTKVQEDISGVLSRINSAFGFLKAQKKLALKYEKDTKDSANPYKYNPVTEPPFSSIARMSYTDFELVSMREAELFSSLNDLEGISEKQIKVASEKQKILSEIEQLTIFENLHVPFSAFHDTQTTSVILGYVPSQRRQDVDNLINKSDLIYLKTFDGAKYCPFVAITVKDNAEELNAALQEIEYVKCPFNEPINAVQFIENDLKKIEKLDKEKFELMADALKKETLIRDLKTLYDFYLIKQVKFTALDNFATTERSFVLEAWYPAEQENKLKELLDNYDCVVYEFREAEENEVVPTLVRSNKIVEPYQDVTNMYSVPNYRSDADPNPIMAFFYFLFFGIMMADAAYGLLLAVGAFVFYKISKPTPGRGRLLLIIAMGGVSTAIWGILFGSYLGFPTSSMTDAGGNPLNFALLFNPLDEPLYMLIMCFALGFLQIVAGMIINAVNLFKRGRWVDALFADFTWFAIFLGIGLIAVSLLLKGMPAVLKYVGIAFAASGALTLVLSGIRGKKGVKALKGILGGFGKLYDGVNILSDILSYSRLFGLALSGGVVAMVVNMICEVVAGFFPQNVAFIGYILCIPVYMVGHAFNLAISTLGAYVHNCRLQYIEFYGKFYEGGGHQFVPFGSMTKYTYIEMPKTSVETDARTVQSL